MNCTTHNGISYCPDGFAYCDRCGSVPIINDKCLFCDIVLEAKDEALAKLIKDYCFHPRQERSAGFCDGRYENFDIKKAAQIIAAFNSPESSQ